TRWVAPKGHPRGYRSVQSVRDGPVDESAARIAILDVVSADEVVGGGRVVRIRRITVGEVRHAQRELERFHTRIARLHIESVVWTDITENAGHRRSTVMVTLLVVLCRRDCPVRCLVPDRQGVPPADVNSSHRRQAEVELARPGTVGVLPGELVGI